jgi:DNA invertase Pin-like site-specific DNA recombinase
LVRIGYARVSTEDQNLALQYDALNEAGCMRIFEDQGISAVGKVRPGFQAALDALAPGDVFVIWKMDRAFRSLRHALDILEQFERRGIEFLSLTDQLDTTTPMGKCMYQIRNAFAELERTLISERTKAGMEAARKRGSILGRPRKLTPKQVAAAVDKLDSTPGLTFTALAKNLNVSARTLGRAVASFRANRGQM